MLFFYAAMQLKPLTALVQDVLAHTFWEMRHIATTHQQHGHHHLHHEIQETAEHSASSSADKVPSSQKLNEEIAAHLFQEFTMQFQNSFTYIFHSSSSTNELSTVFMAISSPPPKT